MSNAIIAAKGRTAKIGKKAVSRANGTAKSSEQAKDKAKDGKLPRTSTPQAVFFPRAWRPRS